MIIGMSTATFTLLHVIISLIGIFTGLVVAAGLWTGTRLNSWTGIFLLTTVLTSVTGFMFPVPGLDPARVVGSISLVVLAIAILGYYVYHLAGAWRWIYVTTALVSLYLNCFVAVVQSFQKIPALHALAPKGNEPPFVAAQVTLMLAFIVIGIVSVRRFHPTAQGAAYA
ncbi:MAG TPA: hypothetical protein VGC34_19015 [Steroidobacteraceae bacterium]